MAASSEDFWAKLGQTDSKALASYTPATRLAKSLAEPAASSIGSCRKSPPLMDSGIQKGLSKQAG